MFHMQIRQDKNAQNIRPELADERTRLCKLFRTLALTMTVELESCNVCESGAAQDVNLKVLLCNLQRAGHIRAHVAHGKHGRLRAVFRLVQTRGNTAEI